MLHTLTPNALARFHARVQKTDTCWLWRGACSVQGYGVLEVRNKQVSAHRVAGVPKGSERIESCPYRHCVNPAHWRPIVTKPSSITQRPLAAPRSFRNQNTSHIPRNVPHLVQDLDPPPRKDEHMSSNPRQWNRAAVWFDTRGVRGDVSELLATYAKQGVTPEQMASELDVDEAWVRRMIVCGNDRLAQASTG